MSILAVQQELHIRERYLEALEQDDFEQFPGSVYARGFLRSYARYLGLDAEELLSRVPKPVEAEPPQVAQPEPQRRRQMRPLTIGRRGSQWPWVVIPLVFLVALLYFVGSHPNLFGGGQPRQTQVTTQPAGHKQKPRTKKHKQKPPVQQATLTPAPPSTGPYGGTETNYTVAKGPITLRLELTAPCYVYLDVDGAQTPQLDSTQTSGTLDYTAQQSFVIKLGNASAATLTVDGQAVSLQGQLVQSIGVSVQQGG